MDSPLHNTQREDEGEDRLSALPDHLLLNILERAGLGTTVRAGTLSRRWTQLPYLLSRLTIDVADFISRPKCYMLPQVLPLYTEATRRLLAPNSEQRAIKFLRLSFFLSNPYMRSICRAVDDAVKSGNTKYLEFSLWTERTGLECSEVHLGAYGQRFMILFYTCPNAFRWLTKLSLRNLRFREADIPNLLSTCNRLLLLSLESCDSGQQSILRIDAPHSQLMALEMLFCRYWHVELIHVPKLVRVVCDTWLGESPPVHFGYVPLLNYIWFSSAALTWQQPFMPSDWLANTRKLKILSLDFRDSMVWIKPEDPKQLSPVFKDLRDVHLRNIFPECDLSWTLFVLEAAPSLKNFYVMISWHICQRHNHKDNAEKANVLWQPSEGFKHYHLSLLDIRGFAVEDKMMKYTRLVMDRAVRLKKIHLHEKEPCNACDAMALQTPSLIRSKFPEEEDKVRIREQLTNGLSSRVEITIG